VHSGLLAAPLLEALRDGRDEAHIPGAPVREMTGPARLPGIHFWCSDRAPRRHSAALPPPYRLQATAAAGTAAAERPTLFEPLLWSTPLPVRDARPAPPPPRPCWLPMLENEPRECDRCIGSGAKRSEVVRVGTASSPTSPRLSACGRSAALDSAELRVPERRAGASAAMLSRCPLGVSLPISRVILGASCSSARRGVRRAMVTTVARPRGDRRDSQCPGMCTREPDHPNMFALCTTTSRRCRAPCIDCAA
jgi:hypothetical protein